MAKEFVKAHLSPATYSDQSVVKFPDATVGETLAYAKTWHVNVSATDTGTVYVFLLPFLEVPIATWDGAVTWRFYSDPNLNSSDWMRDQGVYAFRCLGQSVTAYNTTAEIYKQGNVTAAVLRSCLDRHDVHRLVKDGETYRTYHSTAMMIDGLPLTTLGISSNSKHPYYGKASEGCYLVNRNYGGFNWIFRNSHLNKQSTTQFSVPQVGAGNFGAAQIAFDTSFLLLPRSADSNFPALAAEAVTVDNISGVLSPHPGTVEELLRPDNRRAGVSGLQGNNYGVGVIAFTGLSAQTTFMLKVKHMYEFLLKPDSPYTPLTSPSWPLVPWVEDVIRKQLEDKPDAFDSSANFLGAILNGIKKIWPYVAPLVAKGAAKISELAAASIAKRNVPQKPSRPPPKRPAK